MKVDPSMRRTVLFALTLLIVTCTGAWAASFEGRSACIFPLIDMSPVRGESDRQKALTDAVGLEIQTAGFTLVSRDKWEESAKKLAVNPQDLLEAPAAVECAEASGADVAISGYFSLEDERILVSLSCYDAKGRDLAGGFMRLWRYNLGFYNSLHTAMEGMLSRISLADAPPTVLPETARVPISRITFTSLQNGMEVSLSGEKSIGQIEDGKLVLAEAGMLTGTPLLIEKKMEGYHTAWQTVPARGEIALTPLTKKTSFAVEANWTTGQVVGAGAALRWYPIPDTLFASFSLYPFMQLPAASTANTVLHIDSTLRLGGYLFFPADSAFRMGVSTGFGVIFTTVINAAAPLYTDFYINFINAWMELNVGRFSFFIRSEMKYMLGIGTNLLGMETMNVSYFPPIALGAMVRL
jgi:hypothetical protein